MTTEFSKGTNNKTSRRDFLKISAALVGTAAVTKVLKSAGVSLELPTVSGKDGLGNFLGEQNPKINAFPGGGELSKIAAKGTTKEKIPYREIVRIGDKEYVVPGDSIAPKSADGVVRGERGWGKPVVLNVNVFDGQYQTPPIPRNPYSPDYDASYGVKGEERDDDLPSRPLRGSTMIVKASQRPEDIQFIDFGDSSAERVNDYFWGEGTFVNIEFPEGFVKSGVMAEFSPAGDDPTGQHNVSYESTKQGNNTVGTLTLNVYAVVGARKAPQPPIIPGNKQG
jgi:hypothetical protein